MRQLRAAHAPPRAAVRILCACAALLAVACQSDGGDAPAGNTPAQATPVAVGAWTKDHLHCAQGRCERWYVVRLAEKGSLKVDVYAPSAPGEPDCEMSLESQYGEELDARTGRVKSRRQLRFRAEPGSYLLKVAARRPADGVFQYELNVRVEPPGSNARKTGKRVAKPSSGAAPAEPKTRPPAGHPDVPIAKRVPELPGEGPGAGGGTSSGRAEEVPDAEPVAIREPEPLVGPEPAPAPGPPEPTWIVAEVLDVEEVAGEAQNVMIEAGEPDGLVRGMRGVLVEAGAEIGRIEVIEVYRNGSRARIVGPLSAPISFDTLSRIEVPPDGE